MSHPFRKRSNRATVLIWANALEPRIRGVSNIVYMYGTPLRPSACAREPFYSRMQRGRNRARLLHELASHYHLMFEDWEASMARQAAALGPILEHECGPANSVIP
jgi:hypothetical protein